VVSDTFGYNGRSFSIGNRQLCPASICHGQQNQFGRIFCFAIKAPAALPLDATEFTSITLPNASLKNRVHAREQCIDQGGLSEL
jgi:hypothetical protein